MELVFVWFGIHNQHHKPTFESKNMIIYHFNRCSKSRNALNVLLDNNIEHTVVDYQKNPLDMDVIADLINRSNHKAIDFVRMSKETTIDRDASNDTIIDYLSNHPKFLQRPILDDGVHVIIARPLELLGGMSKLSHLFATE